MRGKRKRKHEPYNRGKIIKSMSNAKLLETIERFKKYKDTQETHLITFKEYYYELKAEYATRVGTR